MPLRKLICIWNYYKEWDIIRGLPSSEVRMPCHKYGPFHIISIPTSKKGKKGKCRLVTIPAEAETAPKCSVFTNSVRAEEWLHTRSSMRSWQGRVQCPVSPRCVHVSEAALSAGSGEVSRAQCVLRALLGAWLGREWSFISAPLAGRIAY